MSTVRSIALVKIIGPVCATVENGQKVHRLVQELLDQGHSVRLDFDNVKLVTPSFYHAVVHNLTSISHDQTITLCKHPDLSVFAPCTFAV